MEIFSQIALKIIREQELIIGPLAWDEARKVSGLSVVNQQTGDIAFNGNKGEILDKLVAQYERLFGRASREVCHDAVSSLIVDMPPAEVPASLR